MPSTRSISWRAKPATTVRSLRVYHERGVLPPPRLKGRTGFYGPEHLNRVHTISRLLDRGIKLNGIKELLNAWDRGDGLGEVLGEIAPSSTGLGQDNESETVTATELAERYRDVPSGLARVVAMGVYEPVDAATYRVADPELDRVVEELTATGVPMSEAVNELEKLRADCDRIARRFVDVFSRTVWEPLRQNGSSGDDRPESIELAAAARIPGRVTAELVNRYVARYLDERIELTDA